MKLHRGLKAASIALIYICVGSLALAASPNDGLCPATNTKLCGMKLTLPVGREGSVYTVAMPARYVAREASWQCIGEWGSMPTYRLMGSETMLCFLKRCDPGTVTVCGLRFDVNVEIPVDEIVKLSVTPDHFASTEITPPGIHVQCKIEGGVRRYATTDDPKKLCGKFACLPTKLSACDSTVFVDRAADPGMVVEARTKDRRSVIVQCLGEEGLAPRYVAVDCNGGDKAR